MAGLFEGLDEAINQEELLLADVKSDGKVASGGKSSSLVPAVLQKRRKAQQTQPPSSSTLASSSSTSSLSSSSSSLDVADHQDVKKKAKLETRETLAQEGEDWNFETDYREEYDPMHPNDYEVYVELLAKEKELVKSKQKQERQVREQERKREQLEQDRKQEVMTSFQSGASGGRGRGRIMVLPSWLTSQHHQPQHQGQG